VLLCGPLRYLVIPHAKDAILWLRCNFYILLLISQYANNEFVLFCDLAAGVVCQDLSISLSMNPTDNGGKVAVNSTVVFRCSVDVRILDRGTAEWYIREGANRYQLGKDGFIHHHLTASRYHFTTESRTTTSAVYLLTISGNVIIIR